MKCPKCKSANSYVDKKGFSGKQAVAGAILAGPLGVAAGTINSNKIKITCLDCGHSYSAGSHKEAQGEQKLFSGVSAFASLMVALFMLLIWWIFDSYFAGILSIAFFCAFVITTVVVVVMNQRDPTKDSRRMTKKEAYYNKIFSQVDTDE